jgi:hypothetical protein
LIFSSGEFISNELSLLIDIQDRKKYVGTRLLTLLNVTTISYEDIDFFMNMNYTSTDYERKVGKVVSAKAGLGWYFITLI